MFGAHTVRIMHIREDGAHNNGINAGNGNGDDSADDGDDDDDGRTISQCFSRFERFAFAGSLCARRHASVSSNAVEAVRSIGQVGFFAKNMRALDWKASWGGRAADET